MRAAAFLLNRYRTELVPMLLLALVVAATAFLAAAGPRLFNRVADDGLRHDIGRATSLERNLQFGRIGTLGGGPGLQPVADVTPTIQAEMPPTLRNLIVRTGHFAESPNWSAVSPPAGVASFLAFRFQDGIEERIDYVSGRAPSATTITVPGAQGTLPGEPQDATQFEIALSTETARELAVDVGDRLDLVPAVNDALIGQISRPERAAVEVVGIYTIHDRDDEYWMSDVSLEVPTIIPITPEDWLVYATALLAADAYPTYVDVGLPLRYGWRYFIDPARLDAGILDELAVDLQHMSARYPRFTPSQRDPESTTLQTALLELIEAYEADYRTAEAVLVTAALGPAAVATAAVALVALLMVHRRRRAVTLVRGRGGSVPQLLGSHLVEGLLVATPPAALAYVAASLLVDARASVWSPIAAALVAGCATLILVLTVLRPATAPLREVEREAPTAARASPRRIAFETLVVVLAASGAVLLRQRGLAGGSAAGDLEVVDPLLAAVPALIGLAVGLVTVRLYPLPVRAAGWFADSWRGMVPALGLRRAARTGDVGSLPLIVLLVTVAIGAFSSTIFITVERGQAAAAWQEVGADFAFDAGSLPIRSDYDFAALPGVEAVAEKHAGSVELGRSGGTRMTVHAVDLQAFEVVAHGTPADPAVPGAMLASVSVDEPIPIIISEAAVARAANPIRIGTRGEFVLAARVVAYRVVDIRRSFPTVDPTIPWVVASLETVRTHVPGHPFAANVILLRAPAADAADLRDAAAVAFPSGHLRAQADVLAELRSGPLVRGVGIGFVIAVTVAIAYAALATTAALVLVAAVRSRETAHLRTLGTTPRSLVALAAIEHGPAIVAATVIGVALGVGVAWFVAPGLDLAGLIGSPIEVVLVVDWAVVGLLLGALVVILATGIGLSTWIGRRANLAGATRQGIE